MGILLKWVRAILALACLLTGGSSVLGSFARVVERADAEQAFQIDSSNGQIAGAAAEQLFRRAPSSEQGSEAEALARRALIADPTSAEAVNVLALQAQLRNETEEARALFEYSLRLSRRELPARIWAIEEAVSRGDIPASLTQYDLAMRTSADAQDLLMPNLIAALAEPKVRAALAPVMASSPPWDTELLSQAAVTSAAPLSVLAFFRLPEAADWPISEAMQAYLVNNLASKGEAQAAWNYYAQTRDTPPQNRSRDAQFAADPDVPAVYDWQPSTDAGFIAEIVPSGDRNVLDFALRPGKSGVIAQQRQALPQGAYLFSSTSAAIDVAERSKPYWQIECADGTALMQADVPNSATNGGRFSAAFDVPAGCTDQTLQLIARPADGAAGVSGQIVEASIVPQ
jgi:hypothetical protein